MQRVDQGKQIVALAKRDGLCLKPDARRNTPDACSAVERGRQDNGAHPALLIIVGCLQQERGLARVHRSVIEVKLCHADPLTQLSSAEKSTET
jgi:hypothetical protein